LEVAFKGQPLFFDSPYCSIGSVRPH